MHYLKDLVTYFFLFICFVAMSTIPNNFGNINITTKICWDRGICMRGDKDNEDRQSKELEQYLTSEAHFEM